MIRAEELTKKYNDQLALDHLNVTVPDQMITGLIGPNGAGKSTFMKLICGFIPSTSGKVFLNDAEVDPLKPVTRRKVGYLPENNPLYFDMYVKEYLAYVAGIYRLKNVKDKIQAVIEMTGLQKEQHKKIGLLSKGYKQRVGLAQAIIHDPEVLILDEPTSGLDPNQIVEIRELISTLGKNKTVLLSTHILQEVEAICQQVLLLNNGKLVRHDKTENIQHKKDQVLVVEFDKAIKESVLLGLTNVEHVKPVSDSVWMITGKEGADIRADLFKFAVEHNMVILSSQVKNKKFEDIFRELTGNK